MQFVRDMSISAGYCLLAYLALYGVYRVVLHIRGGEYSRESVVHWFMLPFAIGIGELAKDLFL